MKPHLIFSFLALCFLAVAVVLFVQNLSAASSAPPPPIIAQIINTPTPTPTNTPTPTLTPTPTRVPPTLADFWEGSAEFVVDVENTGLPMGESDTRLMPDGQIWSYLHASDRSSGTVDQCGDPVPFPGCTVIYRSEDGGQTFSTSQPPVCQFTCRQCPCDDEIDHITQQQYPRVDFDGDQYWLVYEYLGRTALRRSPDGLQWSPPEHVAYSGLWQKASGCQPEEWIYPHPFTPFGVDQCLAGGPPGIYIEGEIVYVFVGLGQNPGHVGCFYGSIYETANNFQRCENNPLIQGALDYGPLEAKGPSTDPYWDYRMQSSAEVIQVDGQYYMFFEGIRGPGPGDPGDTQFGLGLARSLDGQINGRWETLERNPLLVDMPGNIGLGHADVFVLEGQTYLITSLDGQIRSRLALRWLDE